MKNILLILYIGFTTMSCTATIPTLATYQNEKNSAGPSEITIPKLAQGDKVIITTKEFNTYIGEVQYFTKLKSDKKKIYSIDLNRNDTITVATISSSIIGKFQKIEGEHFILENDSGESISFKVDEIITIFQNGQPKRIRVKINTMNDIYELKILYASREITFASSDIHKIEKVYKRVSYPKAVFLGMMIDIIIVFLMLLEPTGNLPLA